MPLAFNPGMNRQLPPVSDWRARHLALGVTHGDYLPQDIVQTVIARVRAFNPVLNALVDIDEAGALDQAGALRSRLDAGEHLPMAGVPFTVKDNLWVDGRPATQGSLLFRDQVAPRDSWPVERLRQAGAICIGITNTPEFACKGMTDNLLHGVTRNPWDTRLTPGGSSGGAVAAVAAGLGPVALGTDAGGSTRRPAAHTGLVGFKCTLGLIPNPWGFEDPSHDLSSVGLIARDVEDIALMLDALAQYHPGDPLSHPLPRSMQVADPFMGAITGARLRRAPRVAFSPDLGCGFAVDDDVARAVQDAVDAIAATGIEVESAQPRWSPGTFEYPLVAVQQAGLAALYGDAWRAAPDRFDPDIAAQIEAGLSRSGADIARMAMRRNEMRVTVQRFFEQFDFLLCPTAPVEAWPCEGGAPQSIGGRPASARGHAAFTPLFNYADVPAISVPCGVGRNGLPVGLQIIAPRYGDAELIGFAAQVQSILGVRLDSPMILSQPAATIGATRE
ncbi:MAG: amidase [Burkholderiales bacterium]